MARSIQLVEGKCGFNAETKPEWTVLPCRERVSGVNQDSDRAQDRTRIARADDSDDGCGARGIRREASTGFVRACDLGKDLWTPVTGDIDHEKIHTSPTL